MKKTIFLTLFSMVMALMCVVHWYHTDKNLRACRKAYSLETMKDKSWDCNPEIKMLVDDLKEVKKERNDFQQKYLELLVEKQQRIN